ncbi:hypothetical protein Clacol_005652 [Clathrus columnatus]|uniref:Helicase C-terminal domain-containing protein n=1 Tax=Clathrus columnatus TaxID=1419009 RepID=A0AAV5AE02_9AGAM|nr:hypothetical protein Clacol_005652 [Clathrus columnatus]
MAACAIEISVVTTRYLRHEFLPTIRRARSRLVPFAMAKDKLTRKNQPKLTKFFKKSKDVSESDASDNEASNANQVVSKGSNNKLSPDQSDLPPINDIASIFADLTNRIPQIQDVVERIRGRKLRVATMCSGTESPLLALNLICRSIKEKYGMTFNVEHIFSCEIEPFKQAYIERNFKPPILFRDVCELGGEYATTAYGSRVKVPGDVDILIAGTSCVDYSNLNNEKQDIDAEGESGRTFRGMMSWVTNHRPPIVILENVCGAPWDKVQRYFEAKSYSAAYMRVDTKNFYIPHTRTRVYLMAVDKKKSDLPGEWKELLKQFYRPASSTLDAFLLPTDDSRIYQAREKLVQESFGSVDRRTGRTDWGRCESRHQRARLEEELGNKRPLTGWDEGGYCNLPDFAWNDWGVIQVERVWDLMDISLLRAAKHGVDPSYKTQVWNLSQNVDRNIGTRPGICPCLTPSMIPYITNRGGPMIGLEALSLQGLPIDELLLTRETEDQLADLAGNAMSTTVVGASIMAALIVGKKLLKIGDDGAMEVDSTSLAKQDDIMGEDRLSSKELDLTETIQHPFKTLLRDADRSSRLCECEGRTGLTSRTIRRCQDCGTSTCVKCGGRPEHNYAPIDFANSPRISPSKFDADIKTALPMCVNIGGLDEKVLDEIKRSSQAMINDEDWDPWRVATLSACRSELRFSTLKRQEIWVAIYDSPTAVLELLLHPKQPEWRLFGKPESSVPANSPIRKLLSLPVARSLCNGNLLAGEWELALPHKVSFDITLKGTGELVASWESRLGLQGATYKDRQVHTLVEISVPEEYKSHLDRDISGLYTYLPQCGNANGSLHKKVEENTLPNLFFFIDPTRCGEAIEDPFVFSIDTRRYELGETRSIICSLDPKWRQTDLVEPETVKCHIPCKWVLVPGVGLQLKERPAEFKVPAKRLDLVVSQKTCANPNAILICNVALQGQAGSEWPRDEWKEVDAVHARTVFQSIGWIIERVKRIDGCVDRWVDASIEDNVVNCERCAPIPPKLLWKKIDRKVKAIEDQSQAGAYEHALKHRPNAFVTQLKLDTVSNIGSLRIGVNMPSLIHRAVSRLPVKHRSEPPTVSWRLTTNYTPPAKLTLPKFQLIGNKQDPEHSQPPNFKIPLRREQLRSLSWMIKQESREAKPFIEEEIAEAMFEPLGWRAEGRAQRPVRVRGGVLADEVGYGKTAITLGLIDCLPYKKSDAPPDEITRGRISVKGSLIVVPPHLTRQWASEVKKFCGNKFDVVVISTAANLNSLTIENIQNADIVIVASNLFKSSVYLANLEAFSAAGTLPIQEGRYFNVRLRQLLSSLKDQIELLKGEGAEAVSKKIVEAELRSKYFSWISVLYFAHFSFVGSEPDVIVAPIKRLKGKQYKQANEDKSKKHQDTPKGSVDASQNIVPSARLKCEIIVPPLPKKNKNRASSHESELRDEESDAIRPHRRKATKSVIVISDSNSDNSDSNYSDMDLSRTKSDGADESSDLEHSVSENDSSEDEKPRPRSVKVKPPKKSRPVKGGNQSETSMDVDEPGKGRKRKSEALESDAGSDELNPKKKAKMETKPKVSRSKADPWKLKSTAVRKDWKELQAPPLEIFHFHRLVIDEYTYLDGKTHSLITSLQATCRWVLSGTPPVHDFPSLKTIAVFLDIHLGIDDDGECQSAQVKKRKREQTEVEKFHSFREVRSLEWHGHRHQVGQGFLDQFVRQNKPEIDEIPATEHHEKVVLPAAERAIYLELEHHLRALDMTIKRGRKNESDREKRLQKSLGESSSAEEALLKRCSHFDLDTSDKENAMKACEIIVKDRTTQLEECRTDLLKNVAKALEMQKRIGKTEDESLFQEWLRVTRTEGVGDREATNIILAVLKEAGADVHVAPLKTTTRSTLDAKPKATGKTTKLLKGKVKEKSQDVNDLIWEHREHAHDLRKLAKELVGRVRSLRYFTVVRDLQKQKQKDVKPVDCPSCKRQSLPISEIGVLSSCGHMGCIKCVIACAEQEECVYHASGDCNAAARVLNVVKAETLGVDDVMRDGKGKHFGRKLEQVVDLIKNRIPESERVLVFVQFPDLMKKVNEALTANKIKFLEIKGTATVKSKNLETFQNETVESHRVLLLNVTDESASGANLTSANHAIFLSPLLTLAQEIYDACETQAIGRLRRFGQTKMVHIWRFLTLDTIDTEIYEKRSDQKL